MENIDLSVICPIYNNVNTMLPMITSFQQQDINGWNVEYVFVCNGCIDNSEDVLKELMLMFPNAFKYYQIIHEDFSDTGLARQSGVKHANGKYIIFCDMDDWLLSKTMFKELLDITKVHPNCLIKYNFDIPKKDWFYIKDNNICYNTYWHIKNKMTCTVWRYLFPKEIFKHVKFNGGLHGEDDLDLMKQISKLDNIKLVSVSKEFYFWNYMDPRSYSYKQMMKNQILTKQAFLSMLKQPYNDTLKEEIEHLL